ncbi:unnamed protein product [Mytilus edulis]|uniref:CUB domain-containing protein n=1 Tax=Mytilus edulis TaxID=6550 RepID=A0A8S3TKX6_MYTED|nr:unnamed protein product [Mytilus edulis]
MILINEYIIQSPTKQPITLVFEDFDIEDDDDCTKRLCNGINCQDFKNHFLHFLPSQVKDGANILLGTFCGDDIPYPLLALSGVIILKFHSNNEDNEKGFRAVRDGISQSSKQLGKFCGRRIPRIPVIPSGTVFVIFRSNNVAPWSGFKAEYKEYKEVPFLDCSGFLNVSMGRIQSPKHPEKYDSNTDCVYTLASQYNGNCTYDFVEIYDSNTSIGNSVRVVFHSDSSRNYKGFSANFAEITVDQATDEVLTTVSFFPTSGNMRNNNITPFTNTSSVNSVVIGAGTGGIIAVIAVITIICVIIGRQRRTQTNRIKRTIIDAGNADDFCECDNSQVKLNTCKEQDTDLDSQLTELLQQSTSDWKTDNASDRNNFNQPNK